MSYDLDIRADDGCTKTVAEQALRNFLIRSIPGLLPDGSNCLIYEPSAGTQFQVYLVRSKTDSSQVESVGICIPYPSIERIVPDATDICFTIAAWLGWQVYDPQVGRYVTRNEFLKNSHEHATVAAAVTERYQRPWVRDFNDHTYRTLTNGRAMVFIAVVSGGVAAWLTYRAGVRGDREVWFFGVAMTCLVVVLVELVAAVTTLKGRPRRTRHLAPRKRQGAP